MFSSRPLIYFARAMDELNPQDIISQGEEVALELDQAGLQMVDPFVEVSKRTRQGPNIEEGRSIVDNDLALLRRVDGVLMDLSDSEWDYIGCLCELVYAYLWRIPVAVYTGDSAIIKRKWLQYHAAAITKTRDEAMDFLSGLLL